MKKYIFLISFYILGSILFYSCASLSTTFIDDIYYNPNEKNKVAAKEKSTESSLVLTEKDSDIDYDNDLEGEYATRLRKFHGDYEQDVYFEQDPYYNTNMTIGIGNYGYYGGYRHPFGYNYGIGYGVGYHMAYGCVDPYFAGYYSPWNNSYYGYNYGYLGYHIGYANYSYYPSYSVERKTNYAHRKARSTGSQTPNVINAGGGSGVSYPNNGVTRQTLSNGNTVTRTRYHNNMGAKSTSTSNSSVNTFTRTRSSNVSNSVKGNTITKAPNYTRTRTPVNRSRNSSGYSSSYSRPKSTNTYNRSSKSYSRPTQNRTRVTTRSTYNPSSNSNKSSSSSYSGARTRSSSSSSSPRSSSSSSSNSRTRTR